MKVEYQPNRNPKIESSAFILRPESEEETRKMIEWFRPVDYVYLGILEYELWMTPEVHEICQKYKIQSREYEVFYEIGCSDSRVVLIYIPPHQRRKIKDHTDKVFRDIEIRKRKNREEK